MKKLNKNLIVKKKYLTYFYEMGNCNLYELNLIR